MKNSMKTSSVMEPNVQLAKLTLKKVEREAEGNSLRANGCSLQLLAGGFRC